MKIILKLRRKRKLLYYLKASVRKVKINKVKVSSKSNNYFFDLKNLYNIYIIIYLYIYLLIYIYIFINIYKYIKYWIKMKNF